MAEAFGAHGAAAVVVRARGKRRVLQPREAALELAAELRQRGLNLEKHGERVSKTLFETIYSVYVRHFCMGCPRHF